MNRPIRPGEWFALSEAQRAHWFMYSLDGASQGWHNPGFCARLESRVDGRRFSAALQRLVARHPMLRTVFRQHGDEIQQAVCIDAGAEVLEADASALSDAQLSTLVQSDLVRPFDLARGPLVRAHLYHCGTGHTVMLLAFDHLAVDGWSYWLLLEELGILLEAGDRSPSALPVPEADYRAYVNWQQHWLAGPESTAQLRYWQQELAGELPVLGLPFKQARPDCCQARQVVSIVLPAALSGRLRVLTRQQRGTMFATLLTAYHILLQRHTGQQDIIVGAPLPARTSHEWDRTVGNFVNPVALRARFDGSIRVAALLRQVRDGALRAISRQALPLSRVIQGLQPARGGADPVFQTMFLFQHARHGAALARLWQHGAGAVSCAWGGFTLTPFPVAQSGALGAVGLVLEAVDLDDQLRCDFKYAADLLDGHTVERMAAHFCRLLEGMARDPDAAVGDLPMLEPEESHRLLAEFGQGSRKPSSGRLVHQLFERQAIATPCAIALVHEGQSLSYGTLNRRANRLAHRLLARGIEPDQRVALYAQRGPEMIVALLGILKAGAAYVPLGAEYPAGRIAAMLADCKPAVVLTQPALRAALGGASMPVLIIDEEAGPATVWLEQNPVVAGLTPRHLAYVIYTSGSTGQPKGVMVEHASIANLVEDWCRRFGRLPEDGGMAAALWTINSFDVSLFEILVPLTQGGTLHIVPGPLRVDPASLLGWLCQQGITLAYLPPFFVRYLREVSALQIAELKLKLVLVGVEPLMESELHRLQQLVPALTIVNGYGPTEATVFCTTYEPSLDVARRAPIGRPLANTQIYLLDGRGQPVPPGVAGEIHIGGSAVARGYLNQPALTAERFVCDPYGTGAGGRLYRTGDLGRWLPGGDLEFIGRNDAQLKIRGYRIEPGEIEARLAACPGVREAVVIAREDRPGERRLVAYLVANDNARLDAVVVRAALEATLPDYMVPTAYVMLDALPLSPNGKLERARLPAPDLASHAERAYKAPEGLLETTLARIWRDLLDVPRVGRDDHFFELGGHSLLVVQLASRLRLALRVDISLAELLAHPSLRAQAGLLALAGQDAQPPITQADRSGALPLSWAQQRLWFLDQLAPSSALYNMPAALRLDGELDLSALRATLNHVARRHESLRTTFAASDGTPVQHIAAQLDLRLPISDLSGLPDAERGLRAHRLAQEEAQTPFDLAAGPLIRAGLLRLAQDQHILLITLHHIVADGWSMRVLVGEVSALYGACVRQQPSPLPELAVQYADFAVWQRQSFSGERRDAQLDYWRAQLAEVPALLGLPTDRARLPVPSQRGARLSFEIGPAATTGLRTLARQARATLFIALAAVLNALLARLTGQSDICVGTPVANRGRAELEPLIGFFVNTLVLRARVDSDAPFSDLLLQVRDTALDAYAHQDLPFEQLVDALKPERHAGHSPLFQVMLLVQDAPLDALQLPGLTIAPMATEEVTAKFDLTLGLTESAGRLLGSFDFCTDLFDRATIARMAGQFGRLVDAVVADPSCRVADLPLLDQAERHQLLHAWNATTVFHPDTPSIQRLFEVQAARTPEAVAVQFDGATLCYADLNAQANQLAHHLRDLGVGPELAVGVCIERSPAMIVALLAILKAGAAYVALDPAYPAARLSAILADAAPAVLLTQQHLLTFLPAGPTPLLCVDSSRDALAACPSHNPVPLGFPHNLAYILYTSGSTGKAKGVAMSVAALHNLILWQVASTRPDATAPSRTLQFASLNFDVSFEEIFTTLCCGDTLVLIDDALHLDMERLRDFIVANDVQQVYLPNAVLQQFAALAPAPQPPGARAVRCNIVTAGEKLQISAPVAALAAAFGGEFLLNQYGPSETHLATQFRLDGAARGQWPATPPIGRPIANTRIYLLDARLDPVPPGVAGELHIAGTGLARGYQKQPGLTASRFIPDPYSTDPGQRMYCSGDLARYLPDGNIEFLGRSDDQVKIRGCRVEPGEVAAALSALPEVSQAVVVVHETRADDTLPSDPRLLAYLVPTGGATPTAAALRVALAATLPAYMIPSHFVLMEHLPLTPNGKLDRRALPPPDLRRDAEGYVAPDSPTEQVLATVWAEVLKLDRVGIHDNFFAIGGHSLLATQLVSKLRHACGTELSLRTLFEAPTVAELSIRIDYMRWLRHGAAAPGAAREPLVREEI